jgi:hypothetical protein
LISTSSLHTTNASNLEVILQSRGSSTLSLRRRNLAKVSEILNPIMLAPWTALCWFPVVWEPPESVSTPSAAVSKTLRGTRLSISAVPVSDFVFSFFAQHTYNHHATSTRLTIFRCENSLSAASLRHNKISPITSTSVGAS